jgi:UDP-N-acetylglucosamine transferase subunit ALG13
MRTVEIGRAEIIDDWQIQVADSLALILVVTGC